MPERPTISLVLYLAAVVAGAGAMIDVGAWAAVLPFALLARWVFDELRDRAHGAPWQTRPTTRRRLITAGLIPTFVAWVTVPNVAWQPFVLAAIGLGLLAVYAEIVVRWPRRVADATVPSV